MGWLAARASVQDLTEKPKWSVWPTQYLIVWTDPIFLTIYLSAVIWAVSIIWLLWIMLLWTVVPGGGHGNPLQYSCLENPMDRGTWWATVHRVAKSRSLLKRRSMHTRALVHKYLFESLLLILLGIYLGVELLGYVVVRCSVFSRITKLFFTEGIVLWYFAVLWKKCLYCTSNNSKRPVCFLLQSKWNILNYEKLVKKIWSPKHSWP